MAIYKLIQNTVFEPKDIERLVTAYEQTLRALRLKDRSDPITHLVAEKIIAIGRLGIEDPAARGSGTPVLPSPDRFRARAQKFLLFRHATRTARYKAVSLTEMELRLRARCADHCHA